MTESSLTPTARENGRCQTSSARHGYSCHPHSAALCHLSNRNMVATAVHECGQHEHRLTSRAQDPAVVSPSPSQIPAASNYVAIAFGSLSPNASQTTVVGSTGVTRFSHRPSAPDPDTTHRWMMQMRHGKFTRLAQPKTRYCCTPLGVHVTTHRFCQAPHVSLLSLHAYKPSSRYLRDSSA